MNYSKLAIFTATTGLLSGITVAESINSTLGIDALQSKGELEGWTFDVSNNPATEYDLADLTGVVEPKNWRQNSRFDEGNSDQRLVLPTTYDWRNIDGENLCTPIRNQAGCGSCWAFAVMGSMESNVRIHDELAIDLSEQWLVSCCNLGGCSGEWPGNAANYLLESGTYVDDCGDYGATYESEFPYVASDVPCGCPYTHPYTISDWAFIGPQWGTPSTDQLKEAIMEHGPITVCVTVNDAFQAYNGGIFNASDTGDVNHAVVLVGWDDSQGANGVWFMRNSWNTWWGEAGYMRIEYGCSKIGFGALYLDYPTQNGACCLNDYCLYGPETACDSVGGSFNGLGTHCDDVECLEPCVGDITGDTWVDVSDILEVINQWGTSNTSADLNGDGIVDVIDLLEVVGNWGPCQLDGAVQWTIKEGGNGHWYRYNWDQTTGPEGVCWSEARERCLNDGGDLVSVSSQAESDFIQSTICPMAADAGGNLGWLGLMPDGNGALMWSNGEAVNWTNWETGQPSGDGPYATFNGGCADSDMTWNDIGGEAGCHNSNEAPLAFWITEWSD